MVEQRRYLHLTQHQGLTFSRGDSGRPVKELQIDLQRLGYYRGPIDGLYGPRTAAAVRVLQSDVLIASSIEQASGRVGRETAEALVQMTKQRTGIALEQKNRLRLEEISVSADRYGLNLFGQRIPPQTLIGGGIVALTLGAITHRLCTGR